MAVIAGAPIRPDLALPSLGSDRSWWRAGGGERGAVLSQRLPDGGERPGAHMSRGVTALRIVQTETEPVSYSGWRFCNSFNGRAESDAPR